MKVSILPVLIILIVLLGGAALIGLTAAPGEASVPTAEDVPGLPEFTYLSADAGDLPPPTAARQQSASIVMDVDQDGISDFVIGSRVGDVGPYLVWYKYTQEGWTRYLIEDQEVSMSPSGTSIDVDGDGDRDVVMGGGSERDRTAGKIWWWENPHPNHDPAVPWNRYTIKTSGRPKHHDMLAADLDRDGQEELVYWNQYAHGLFLAELPADPKSLSNWPTRPIFEWPEDRIELEGLETADVDLDGWPDLVGAGRWFKNNHGGTFTAQIIDLEMEYGRVAVGDLIPGGHPEIVMTIGDGVGPARWYEWQDRGWTMHEMGEMDHAHTLQVVDINGDGFLDIYTAEMRLDSGNPDSGNWFFLGDGRGGFRREQVSEGHDNHENRVLDLDGDGDLDILGKPFNHELPGLNIWINAGAGLPPTGQPPLDRWQRRVIDDRRPWRALFIEAGDLNGDGLTDAASGAWWYQNPGPDETGWQRHAFGGGLNNLAAVYDFDGDGDLDVLGTQGEGSQPNSTFLWAQNDGQGGFTVLDNIAPAEGSFLQGAAVDRFAGGQLGVAISWHNEGSAVQLITVPADPASETWPVSDLYPDSHREGISAGDIDGDGQVDLLLGAAWLRGSDGRAVTLHRTRGEPDRNLLADINGDGRLDALLGYEADDAPGPLAWYEQGQRPDRRWTEHIIASPPIIAPMSVSAADMDGDGDLDVVAGEHNRLNTHTAGLYIFENLDGTGLAWRRHTVALGDEHHGGARVVDIDGDGDLDILSIGWTHPGVLLYENLAVE